jgi:short-subunit dehydrogenase
MPLIDGAVVITGASSGVGRATAHAFARRGASLVLAARGRDALEEVAAECRGLGAEAIALPTDVRDREAVRRLADEASHVLGGIAVWVNNAGVGAVGRYWEVPLDAHRAVVETNLLGSMHGAYAALPFFLRRGRGVLINNISIGGFVPSPFAAAYAASKFGVRAFSDSLRQELIGHRGIHVCAVYPYFIDTPGVQHGANYTGRALRPAPLVVSPERVARTILDLVDHPRDEVIVGTMAKLARLQHWLLPRLADWIAGRGLHGYLSIAPSAPQTDGNLFEPSPPPMTPHGGWYRPGERLMAVTGLGLAAGAAALLFTRRR